MACLICNKLHDSSSRTRNNHGCCEPNRNNQDSMNSSTHNKTNSCLNSLRSLFDNNFRTIQGDCSREDLLIRRSGNNNCNLPNIWNRIPSKHFYNYVYFHRNCFRVSSRKLPLLAFATKEAECKCKFAEWTFFLFPPSASQIPLSNKAD